MKSGIVVVGEFQGVMNRKRRPAIVVSSETYHSERPDVILAVVTSRIEKANASTDYVLQDWQSSGLNVPSSVRMFLFTLPKTEIKEIGKLSANDFNEVRKRLRIALDF